MQKIIEMMIDEKILTKSDISTLHESKPPKKATFANLIGEHLIEKAVVEEFLAKKIRQGKVTFDELELIDNGFDVVPVIKDLAKSLGANYIDLDNKEIDMHLFSKLPFAQLMKNKAIPIEENELSIIVVFADPFDLEAQDAIQRLFPKKPIVMAISRPKQVIQHLQGLETNESIKNIIADIRKDLTQSTFDDTKGESSAILKLIDIILKSAIYAGASDIHIEAMEKSCLVRERIDGMLKQSFSFDKDIFPPLSSRVKLLANLDIAEKRKPQDGRFGATISNREFDFRASSLPTLYGESIVLRILDKTKVLLRLEEIGMSSMSYDKFSEAIKVPYGIVLVTGPTGSGKTTTLYGAINAIKDIKDKIITVEDPVEYQMNGIQQVQVNPHAGLDFSNALRSILRQDPNKIMIGEIRDTETLRIAIQAALTGHLVLSTLHTNDAISSITRMLDMGIESYLVSGSLIAIQAQRLVRKICPHCKTTVELPDHTLKALAQYLPPNPVFYKGAGCKECRETGYLGREMISEVLIISEKFTRMIASNASKEDMIAQAAAEGFVTMFEDGVHRALEGKTTIEEIYRVVRL